jgi:N-alpha-acetyltransferase 15/16, NatA auxiliary subunit
MVRMKGSSRCWLSVFGILKRFLPFHSPGAVVKHFNDFQEDQFDFHSYCLRKVTLRAYVSVLRFEDEVYGQDYFCQAAAGIIRIYLHLYDNPAMNEAEEPDYSKMDAAERKKAKAVARKKKKASEKKETVQSSVHSTEADATANGNQKANAKGKAVVVDEDPLGMEYLKKDPLQEAKKYSSMLAQFAPQNLETWIFQYDTALRRKKPLLALQALFKARSVDKDSCALFSRIVDFVHRHSDAFTSTASPAVRSVMSSEVPLMLGGHASIAAFVAQAAARIAEQPLTDLPMRTAVAKALVDIEGPTAIPNGVALIVPDGMQARKVTVDSCQEALAVLQSFGDDAVDAVNRWTEQMAQRFPPVTLSENNNGASVVKSD